MKIEVIIYSYLFISIAMIMFNIACGLWFRYSDKELVKESGKMETFIAKQIKQGKVDEKHKKYLEKNLKNEQYLLAFDRALENLYELCNEQTVDYIKQLDEVFTKLTVSYSKRDELKATFFPYLIHKYNLFAGESNYSVNNALLNLLRSSSVYCRENSLYAIYSIGDVELVIKALRIVDSGSNHHNSKLITDGLSSFNGNKDEFNNALWDKFDSFSTEMKVAIMDYFRFSKTQCLEKMYELLDLKYNNEINYSAIRYFGKQKYQPAYEKMIEIMKDDSLVWEYKAITALSLSSYKTDECIEVLKQCLHSERWFIRYNASISLNNMNLDDKALIDIIEGDDRYARDIVKYISVEKELKIKGREKVSV